MPPSDPILSLPSWIITTFRWHRLTALIVMAVSIALNAMTGRPWWSIWVVVAAIAAVGAHYLAYKTMTIDDAWVDARAEEIHVKSYDRGHIQEMSERRGLETPADRIKQRRRPAPKA